MKNKQDTIKLLNDLRQDLMLEYQSNPLLYKNPSYPKIEALDQAINALYVLGQVAWERDVAIQQLDELGYGLAERTNDKYKCDLCLSAEDFTCGTMMLTKAEYNTVKRVTDPNNWDDLDANMWSGLFSIECEELEENG